MLKGHTDRADTQPMNTAALAPAPVSVSRVGRHLLQYLHSVTSARWTVEQRPRGMAFPVTDHDGVTITYLCLIDLDAAARYRRLGSSVAAAMSLLVAAEPDDLDLVAAAAPGARPDDPFDGRLLAHFQPIVEFGTGSVVAVEALARLSTGTAILGPEAFLDSVDTPGTMMALFHRMLDDSLAFLAEQRIVAPHLSAAVKLEFAAVPDKGLAAWVAQRLAAHATDAASLTVELNERCLSTIDAPTVRALRELTDVGVQLVLADIEHCTELVEALPGVPLAGTKLGRRFVSRITDGEAEFQVAADLIGSATELGLEVIADGVETRAQIDRLLRLGCRFGQGYLFAVPQPGASLADVIDAPLVSSR
jgi:EAL domain-containing protein (putative c-di-GMP-specific phosphodiesterase class I)